jgi:hypothetical protein
MGLGMAPLIIYDHMDRLERQQAFVEYWKRKREGTATMPPYDNAFKIGVHVRVQSRDVLEAFARDWKYHNNLSDEQLAHAGVVTQIKAVGFYHGGDPLYELTDAPGLWHEENLLPD